MSTIPFKRGDTFLLTCAYTLDGVPAQIPFGVRSQLRDRSGTLVAELVFTPVDAATGVYTLEAPASATQAWPLSVLYGDIQYTDSEANVASTDTYLVAVTQDVTHD